MFQGENALVGTSAGTNKKYEGKNGEAGNLTRKCIDLALEDDVTALRLCLKRLRPPRKDRPIPESTVKLPPLKTLNLTKAKAVIIRSAAGGKLTPSEGEAISRMLEAYLGTVELTEIEERLTWVEQVMEAKSYFSLCSVGGTWPCALG